MSDNEASSEDEVAPPWTWIPYSQREEWSDVVPIEQDDGPYPIVPIAYSEKFRETHNYFRAILKSQEKSERALNLTADCLWLNTGNYTVWQYRRDIIKELKADLTDELKFTQLIIKCNIKNYQVWHHRRVIVEWMEDCKYESEFTNHVLEKDSKNYHAWQHRQWYISHFNLFDGELEYTRMLIEKDIYNNSAWNQRYFVISNTTKFTPEDIEFEVDFTLEMIGKAIENESAWNYLRGIMMHDKNGGLAFNKKILDTCKDLYNNGHREYHLLACIVDICQERHSANEPEESLFHINRAFELCRDLAEKYDKIRKRYWNYVNYQMAEKLKVAF